MLKIDGKPSTKSHGNFVMNFEVNSQSDAPKNKSNTLTLVLEKLCEEMKELQILAGGSTPTVGAISMVNSSTN